MKRLSTTATMFAVLALLALSACGVQPKGPAQTVYVAESGFNTSLQLAVAYASRPRCTKPVTVVVCSDPVAVHTLNVAAQDAWVALRAAEAAARAVDPDATRIANAQAAANAAIKQLASTLTELRVN